MDGWQVPPPKEPAKIREEFRREREEKVKDLIQRGFLQSDRLRTAMVKVPREDFIPASYRDYAYREVPLPLPGEKATISCPHSYPLFYEPLDLDAGDTFLEIGLGSGYGTALAREVVGEGGLVVSIKIDPLTFTFAKENLVRAGYTDIILLNRDGALGNADMSPYDSICLTAACPQIPPPLVEQLKIGGRLIAPVIANDAQNLVLVEKHEEFTTREVICQVLYVSLRGQYGVHDEGGS